MTKRGRPRKAGKRYPSGKLIPFDKGAGHVQERRERFGNHYTTALGRAFASGLLGDDAQAQARYSTAKRFSRLYGVYIEHGRYYGCPLGREERSTGSTGQMSGNREDQDWLFACMDALDQGKLRPWLDLLILEYYHDVDPPFLGRLLNKGRDPADKAMMARCIEALDAITPAVEVGRIRAVRS